MSLFEFVTVAISIVLGLGMTQLLSGAVTLVRQHRGVRIHWIPLAWATAILWVQVTFWWQLFSVSDRSTGWTYVGFVVAIITVLLLSAAGSLILPRGEAAGDLMEHFREEGRLGVAAFALFNLSAIAFNRAVYEAPVVGPLTLQIIAMVTIQAAVFFSRRTKWIAGFTICYWLLHLYVMRRVIVPAFGA